MPLAGKWLVEYRTGTAEQLHAAWPEEKVQSKRVVALCEVSTPVTLVLGSTQPEPLLDVAEVERTGLVVSKRTSGGGAVLVAPGEQVWVDVWLPRGDPLWDDDVVRSSGWLALAWKDALNDDGVIGLGVNGAPVKRSKWSDLVCFAGIGPGEVLWEGRKLVGLSQRRVRSGARFLTVSPIQAVGPLLLPLMAMSAEDRVELAESLRSTATCLEDAMGTGPVEGRSLYERISKSVVRKIARIP
jgi:lipoate---protein ligase